MNVEDQVRTFTLSPQTADTGQLGQVHCYVLTHLLCRYRVDYTCTLYNYLCRYWPLSYFSVRLKIFFLLSTFSEYRVTWRHRHHPLHTFCRSRVRKRVTNLEAAESGHARKYSLISMATKVHSRVAFQFYAQDVNKRTFIWNTKYKAKSMRNNWIESAMSCNKIMSKSALLQILVMKYYDELSYLHPSHSFFLNIPAHYLFKDHTSIAWW